MNYALISIATDLASGLSKLKDILKNWGEVSIQSISPAYRRIETETEGTLSAEMVVVFSVATPLTLEELQQFVRKQQMKTPGGRSLLLTFNHQVHLDPQGPVPHPELHLDPLILHCAAEIQGGFEHPVLGRSLLELVKSSQSSFGRARFEFLTRGETLLPPPQEAL